MVSSEEKVARPFSYHTIRGLVGLIALLIATVAAVISGADLGSISASYHYDSQDIFVGSLFVVSAFLGAYNGSPRLGKARWVELGAAKVASFSVFLVALFPTIGIGCPPDNRSCAPEYVRIISEGLGTEASAIHGGAAIVFFAMLFVIMLMFVVRARKKGAPTRAAVYLVCCVGMIASLGFVIFARDPAQGTYGGVFWSEFFALMFFGFGWLYSGLYEWMGERLHQLRGMTTRPA